MQASESVCLASVLPSPGLPNAAGSRIRHIDGLRGIAIISVMCAHYFPIQTAMNTDDPSLYMRFLRLGSLAWSGVDLFFVLSGFLIGRILLDNQYSINYYRSFYARRLFRIVPLYFCFLSFFLLLILLSRSTNNGLISNYISTPFSPVVYFLFIQNFFMSAYDNLGFIWATPTWSLAVEEHFYMLAPLLIRLGSRRILPIICACTVVAALSLRVVLIAYFHTSWIPVYVVTPAHMDPLFVGVFVAWLAVDESRREWVGGRIAVFRTSFWILACMMILIILFQVPWENSAMLTIGPTVISLFYGNLVLLGCFSSIPGQRLLSVSMLRRIGIMCFSFYLIHLPVYLLCTSVAGSMLGTHPNLVDAAAIASAFVLTAGLALITWRFVEEPMIRYGRRYRYQPKPLHWHGTARPSTAGSPAAVRARADGRDW